uniref:Uncharacterized protein n=1 Tax=Myoviridae sp. ctbWL16 TaxID=2826668 RepID=A0A8S5MSD5_9CAUD|nr:MAG TPA: hypothetical protein [Myoviridae sp. ctbWL16]
MTATSLPPLHPPSKRKNSPRMNGTTAVCPIFIQTGSPPSNRPKHT